MPILADIRRHFPSAEIDWVVEEAYTSLVRLNTLVGEVIPFALRRWRKSLFSTETRAEMRRFRQQLISKQYNVVFDTQGLVKTGVVMKMARLSSRGKRIGLANATDGSGYEGLSRIFHDISVPVGRRTHAVLRGRLVAAAALGYAVDSPADFSLQAPQVDDASTAWLLNQPFAVFFHATARAAKQWPQERWVQIGQGLAARNMPVLLAWGNAEEEQAARQLAAQMPNARVLPKLSMMEAVLLAQRAALAIGVDTGLTHIAAAYNRPTIEIYCDSPRWKTEGNWSPNIINLGDKGMPPEVSEVQAAVDALLGPAGESVTDDAAHGLLISVAGHRKNPG